MQVALEIKSAKRVHNGDLKNLKILKQEQKVSRCIIISFEQEWKKLDGIECMHWEMFLQKLWDGDVI